MSAKKPSVAKDPAAKRLTRKQVRERAELAFREALEADHVAPFPEVTPLELAHLVAAMGLGEQEDGPLKALVLLGKSATCIDRMKAQFERLNVVLGTAKAAKAKIMAVLRLGLEAANKTFTVDEVIAKMPTEPLKVAGRTLRGEDLWNEFRRQVDPKPGRPGKADKDGTSPEEYLLSDLLRIYQEFTDWRTKIAAANQAKGSKNLDKANRDQRERDLVDGAEAVDAVPLPKMLKRNTSGS